MKPPSKEEAAALALVPLWLTTDENRLLQRYRATAPHWRADIVDFANAVAKMFPLEKAYHRAGRLSTWSTPTINRGPK